MNLAQTLLPLLLLPLAMNHAEDEIKPLVIVAPKGFEGELKEFVAWKKSLHPTEFVALEDALQQAKGEVETVSLLQVEQSKDWLCAAGWRRGCDARALHGAGSEDGACVRFCILPQ